MKEILRFPIKQVLGNGTKVTVSQKAITEALMGKVNTSLTINGIPLTNNVELNSDSVGSYSKEAIDEMLANMNQTVMIGQGIFLQNNLPNMVKHEGCTYLKSGVTVPASTLPDYPESLKVGVSYPLTQSPSSDYKLLSNIDMFVSCDDYILGFITNSQVYLRFALNETKDKVVWTVHNRPSDLILNYDTSDASQGRDFYFAGHGSRIVGHSHYTNDGINWIKAWQPGLVPILGGYPLVARSVTVSSDGSKWYKCFVYTRIIQVPDQWQPGREITVHLGVQTGEGHIVYESTNGINWSRVPQQSLPVLTNNLNGSSINWGGITRVTSDGEYVCYHSDQAWQYSRNTITNEMTAFGARPQTTKLGSDSYVVQGWDVMADRWFRNYSDWTAHASDNKGKEEYTLWSDSSRIKFIPSKLGVGTVRNNDTGCSYYTSKAVIRLTLTPGAASGHTNIRRALTAGINKDFMVVSDESKSFGWNVFGKAQSSLEADWSNIGISTAQQGLYLRIK